jgi:hypothetical protein
MTFRCFVQNDVLAELGLPKVITYRLKAQVVGNCLQFKGESAQGGATGSEIKPPQYGFWKGHPSLQRYVYGAGFLMFALGAIYPALAMVGLRPKCPRNVERLFWLFAFTNVCFAILEGYCFVVMP